jgi:hypothetical protein
MKRFIVLGLAFAAILSACGQDVVTVGKLTVTISGLPSGSTPSVAVTGPSSFTKTLTASGTLENLTPGTYTITPAAVAVAPDNYTATTATASVTAGQTATSTVTYSKAAPVEVTLAFADFTGGAADSSTQGGKFVNYSYPGDAGTSATNPVIAASQPVKTTDSLSTTYTLFAGGPGYGGVALGVNSNATPQPIDLTGYTKLRIKLARSGGGALSIKVVGNVKAVQDSGCYPVYQATDASGFSDGGFAVTSTLTEYTLDLSNFNFRKYCQDNNAARKTLAETINDVIRVEVEDRFLPGTGSENRTLTVGSITFVK